MTRTVSVARERGSSLAVVTAAATGLSLGISAWAMGAVALSRTGNLTGAVVSPAAPVAAAHGPLPVSFEPNVGQTAPQVQFLTHQGATTVFLMPTQAVWAFSGANPPAPHRSAADLRSQIAAAGPPSPGVAIRMQLQGADPAAVMMSTDTLPGTVNYFPASDPATWHRDVPTYGEVVSHGVYPGIDLAWHGRNGQLEYDFVVAPSGDPSVIGMSFTGASSARLDSKTGDLILSTARGEMRQHAPHAIQDVGGMRTTVGSAFVLTANDRISFRVGAYDRSLPLTIDPMVGYSTYLGGPTATETASMASIRPAMAR